jgi:hypothetical protein
MAEPEVELLTLTGQAMRRLERPHSPPIRPARDEPMPLFDGAAP